MENNTKICGLCFEQISNNNFERLDVDKTRKLKSLIDLNTTVNEQTIICSKCDHFCQESYNFKNACLRNEDYLKTFNRPNDESKLILEDVIVKTIKTEVKCEEERVCRFCLNYFEVHSLVEINAEEDITLKNILGRCLLDIDMSIVQNPLICYDCRGLLEKLFNFISRCDATEVLRNLDTKTDVIVDENISIASTENDDNMNSSIVKKEEIFEDIENPEIQIKSEDFDIDEDVKASVNNNRCKIWSCEEKEKLEIYKCNKCNFSASNECNIVRHNKRGHKDRTQVKHSCYVCPYQTNQKSELKLHYRVHQALAENHMFKCYKCPYVTKRKGNLVLHYKRWHEDVLKVPRYKCDECPYETIWNWRLVSHKITHETKRKSLLKKMKPSDKTKERKFVCDVCSYQTHKNWRLKQHCLVHKEPSEVNILKCDYCSFATKWKTSLTVHATRHRNPAELPHLKCNDCPYETNKRPNMIRHVLVHKDPSQVVMFKCKVCPYETKYKYRVSIHEKKHKVEIYKCNECNYKTKVKRNFMGHVRYHKEWKQSANQNLNEVKQYKCMKCSYVAMQKSNLTKHQLIHKDPSKRSMYSCKECSYQALYKMSVKRHYKKNHSN